MSATPDYRKLFEASPGCNLVLAPDFTILAVSDAYLGATMTTRERIVGKGVFDVFPDNPDDPHASGVANLSASLGRVLALKRSDRMAVQKYDIRRPGRDGGSFEERYWHPLNVPILGEDGNVEMIIHSVEDVTENVRLETDKRQSDQQYRQLLDASPDAFVVVDRTGRIVLVNVETEIIFGYTRAELLGRPISILVPARVRAKHDEHQANFLARPTPRAMGARGDLSGQRKDGSEFPIEVGLSPLGTGESMTVSASIRDVTERKRMERETKQLSDRLASAVESIQDPLAVFDEKGRLILCNSAYRQLFLDAGPAPLLGRSFEELLRELSNDLDLPDSAARQHFVEERVEHRRHASTSTYDVRMRDGRRLRIMERRTAEGGLVTSIWDLTDDERRAEELRAARVAAEAGSAAKSEFLSSMSHELRTPLNAILGFAQLLQRDRKEPLTGRHKERVDHILKGGEHLLHLIDDVLDLSRIEARGVAVSIEPVSVPEVLAEVKRALEPMAARNGVAFAVDLVPASLPMIAADRTRLAQILMNFGSNAIKYNRPSGSVRFSISRNVPEQVRLTVEDTGIGIALELQDKIFQPFQRAGQETGPIEGTGIGLVITQRLATLMGGNIGFRSTAGHGSAFWVELPVHANAAPVAPTRSAVERPIASITKGVRRVALYVEDNPANVTFMEDLLSTFAEVELVTVPTAEIGIDFARAHKPDIVIMDINLPGMSGIDALRALRGAPETETIPVIALTAAASPRDKQRGTNAGFSRYLTKPVNVDELLGAIEEILTAAPGSPKRPTAD